MHVYFYFQVLQLVAELQLNLLCSPKRCYAMIIISC